MSVKTKFTNDNSSGDASMKNEELPPEPKPPLDVELIADVFGFMPMSRQGSDDRDTMAVIQDLLEPAPEGSVGLSSTNIDVVRRYTWQTKNRMTVQLISYGATITAIHVPDKKGTPDDVVAGFDTLEEYFQPRNPYFGATLGRYANTIADGTMVIRPSGRTYMLSLNKQHHHYNGGVVGFDKVNWHSYVNGNKVIMSHVSKRFSEGYPGTMLTEITFEVTCDNTIKIEMKCTTSEPTIVNLSHSLFFNLAGHESGKVTMYDHLITINGDKYTAAEDGIVTGEKKVVGGSPYDFRVPRALRTMMPKMPQGGYDINYCITQGTDQDLTFQARALHPGTCRVVEVYSNQPGMQFYTGDLLPDPDSVIQAPGDEPVSEHENESVSSKASNEGEEDLEEESVPSEDIGYKPLFGKQGAIYNKHGLFCMMPQNYPDAINHRNFPNSVLNPGEVYVHRIQYKFGLLLGKYV